MILLPTRALAPLLSAITLASGLAGCGEKDTDTAASDEPVALVVLSPADGAFLDEGAATQLRAEARDGAGASLEVDDVAWSTENGWAAQGNDIEVSDLPAGSYALQAQALIDGKTLDTSIEISVFAQ
jgi:hypothetical protein